MYEERYRVCRERTRADAYQHFFGKGSRFEQAWKRASQVLQVTLERARTLIVGKRR
jgi:hypothetical protein